ncbi:hypothetical protein [Achromobacter arsenitoxydans]|uniref:Uncharacterized protein n=1 Tax=Achromobacter arsenitoxydans SY8 TaxID=477184 RepID=H0F550_9BURK|nr:hypothetical protein [Achromobacter arsenitoxydans]EHK66629.1 hypothetical protein KYC_09460 [Achromobacter arsenitoxydans SY8]
MPIKALTRTLTPPILAASGLDTLDQFFKRPEVAAFLAQTRDPAHTGGNLRACADLLPRVHPSRAAALALMSGSLVEDGADPAILFPVLQALLAKWLRSLRPFCAQEVEDDDDEVEEADRQAWLDAQSRMAAVPTDERWQVESLHQAVDLLVLPMMTMLMRDRANHQAFIADSELMAMLHPMATLNDSLPFEQLHYLWLASQLSYEDELVVVLPASGTGFIAEAHAINNTFHAFSLLQIIIGEHAQTLGVKREIAAREPDMDGDTADFQWLQAGAYADGELRNIMQWAWGEAALRDHPSRHGKRVLIALETDEGAKRNWSGFNGVIHEAQQPSMTFKRYLTPEEAASYLA